MKDLLSADGKQVATKGMANSASREDVQQAYAEALDLVKGQDVFNRQPRRRTS
jgi:hypothetical protein